jgi:hypothetical protein
MQQSFLCSYRMPSSRASVLGMDYGYDDRGLRVSAMPHGVSPTSIKVDSNAGCWAVMKVGPYSITADRVVRVVQHAGGENTKQ